MKHPDILPDDMARKLGLLAQEHGYGIERLTLSWVTKDLGRPLTARVTYETDVIETRFLDGSIHMAGRVRSEDYGWPDEDTESLGSEA
jgi:hypothetical protein